MSIRPALRLGSAALLLLLVALAAFPHSSAAQVVERPQLRDIETDRELMMYRVYHTITSEVLGIQLYGPAAPAIGIQEAGLGSDINYIRVGMSAADFEAIMGYDYERRLLVSFSDDYCFYPSLGLAASIKNGVVSELVITQVPYEQYWEPGN